jgi:hypothetical protein
MPQSILGAESDKPVRASKLQMWLGNPKARIRLPTENRRGRLEWQRRLQKVAADSGSRPMAVPVYSRECTNLPTSVEERVNNTISLRDMPMPSIRVPRRSIILSYRLRRPSDRRRGFWRHADELLPKERLKAEAKEAARKLVGLARELRPSVIILFGSYAKGNFTETSDIDICLIADKMPTDELTRRTLPGLEKPCKVRVIGFQTEEFFDYLRTLRFLAFDIVADGVVIYDNGVFGKIRSTYEHVIKAHGIVRLEHGWKFSPIMMPR